MTSTSNEQTIANFLAGKGLSQAQVAGVLGNWQVESNFSPTASNPSEGAIGIAQWEGGRRTELDDYAADTGGSETSLATQLNFFWKELTTKYGNAYTALLAATTPTAAASAVDTKYEISSAVSLPTREADADSIYAQITGGSLALTPGASLSSQIGSMNGDPSSIANLDAAVTPTGVVGALAGGISDLLPFGIGKGISAAEGAVVTTVTNYATKFAFIGGGMILVILGLVRASAPVRKQATDTLGQVAPLAAAAA